MTKTEIRQKWLFNELRKYPMNGYRDFLTMYIATFGKSERTFVRDWKEAQKKLKAWNSKVMNTLIAKEVAKGVEEEKNVFADTFGGVAISFRYSKGRAVRYRRGQSIPYI